LKEITSNNKLYAIYDNLADVKNGALWYGDKEQPLQACRQAFNSGKEFRIHRHIERPRTINKTQEGLVVVSGGICVSVFDNNKLFLEEAYILRGGIIILYDGFHNLKVVLENTIFYEFKPGQFVGVEQDKEFYDRTD